jgi:outer membrane protein assembly factor BamB
MWRFWTIVGSLILLQAPVALAAESWPQFRGPTGDGVVTGLVLPTQWSSEANIRWKAKIPGVGWSQPVVWGNKIFLTTAVAEDQPRPDPTQMGPGVGGFAGFFKKFEPPETTCRWLVLCLDADSGEVLWEKQAREGKPTIHIHPNNTYATETPAVDAERLIVHFGMTGLYCYDHSGHELWSKELEAYPTQFGWGTGSSPVIDDARVYLQCDNDERSSLVAFDKQSGEEVWTVERDEKSNWGTPYLWKNSQRTELVAAGGTAMRSYDPETGKLLWQVAGAGRTASTPVSDGDLLYFDSYNRLTGSNGVLIAIKAGGEGELEYSLNDAERGSEFVAWAIQAGGFRISSPTVADGCIYLPEQGGGIVRCLDASSGDEHYRKRIPGASGFSASPIVNDGRVYCLDQAGATFVLEAGPQLNVLASNKLGEMSWSSAGVVGDRLLIRTVDYLYSIGE